MDINAFVKSSGVYLLRIGPSYYVGKSSQLAYRIGGHYSSLQNNAHSNKRLQKAYDEHQTVDIQILQLIPDATPSELLDAERFWIMHYVDRGQHVLNDDMVTRYVLKSVL